MNNTKGSIINDAYSRLRISGLTVDPTPEDMEIGLSRLENMMSTLEARDVRLGYLFEDMPDPSTEHGVDGEHWEMMAANLAVRLAPDFGKAATQDLLLRAKSSMSDTYAITSALSARQVDAPRTMPIGSGNRRNFRYLKYNRPLPQAPQYSNTLVRGNVNDYEENYEAYLTQGEIIESFEIQVDNGLAVVSSSNNDPIINYRIRAEADNQYTRQFLQVNIKITTSAGRIESRLIDFAIREQFQPT